MRGLESGGARVSELVVPGGGRGESGQRMLRRGSWEPVVSREGAGSLPLLTTLS